MILLLSEEDPLRQNGVLLVRVGAAQRVGPAVRRMQPDDVLKKYIRATFNLLSRNQAPKLVRSLPDLDLLQHGAAKAEVDPGVRGRVEGREEGQDH